MMTPAQRQLLRHFVLAFFAFYGSVSEAVDALSNASHCSSIIQLPVTRIAQPQIDFLENELKNWFDQRI